MCNCCFSVMAVARVVLFALLCGIGGTAVGLFFSWSLGVMFGVVSALVAVATVWFSGRRLQFFVFGIFFLSVFSAAWIRSAHSVSYWDALPAFQGMLTSAVVVKEPRQTEGSKQVTLVARACEGFPCPESRVLGIFPAFSDIHEGDVLSVSCRLERPERFSPDIDYPKILAKDGIGYVCRFPREWSRERVESGVFVSFIRSMRLGIEEGLERALPDPEAGLVTGLLVGGDDRMPKYVTEEFSRTGLSHIVAVSGYNVTLVAVLFMNVLIFFGLYRQQAFWGAILGIGIFTILVGSPASAVRAAIMATVALLATRMGRLGNPVNAILFAACAMLLINPLLLRYDIGFQLSFAATIGIFSIAPLALSSLRMNDIAATTLAAEISVLPIILFHFHALPILSFPANILVLPLVPIAMISGVFAVLGSFLVPVLAVCFGFPAFLVTNVMLGIIHFFSEMPIASMSVSDFGIEWVVVWYTVLGAVVFRARRPSLSVSNAV